MNTVVADFFLATTMQKNRSELATVNVTIKLVGLLNKAKKKKKGCLVRLYRPPAPKFWKLEKSFYCTKVYRP